MLTACVVYLVSRDPIDYVLDWTADAHSRVMAARYLAEANTTTDTGKMKQSFGIGYIRPNDFSLTINDSTGAERTRTLFLDQRVLTVLDRTTNQYRQTKVSSDVPIKDAIKGEIPQLDDLVFAMADQEGIRTYIATLRQLRPWTIKATGTEIRVSHQSGPASVALGISPRTGLLQRIIVANQGQVTDWHFTFEPKSPKSVAFQAPKNSYAVSELDPLVHEPTYASAEARAMTAKMFAAYDRPKALAFEVAEAGATTQIWFRPGAIRQRNAQVDFVYRGGQATVLSFPKRTAYSGAAKSLQVIDAVGESGARIDPALRSLMKGQNPFRLLLGENCRVSVKGKMELDGKACTILEADNKVARLSIVVRNRDGLVVSVGSETKDKSGQRTASSQRIIRYLPTSSIDSGEAFKLNTPPDFGRRPLNDIVSKDLLSGLSTSASS